MNDYLDVTTPGTVFLGIAFEFWTIFPNLWFRFGRRRSVHKTDAEARSGTLTKNRTLTAYFKAM